MGRQCLEPRSQTIDDRAYDDFEVDGSTVNTDTPDLIWFEWHDGWIFDWDQDETGSWPPANNVHVVLTDTVSAAEMSMELALKIAGVDTAGNYIAFHVLGERDFYKAQIGWPGVLDIGNTYTVQLDDPSTPAVDYAFTQTMSVAGTTPND